MTAASHSTELGFLRQIVRNLAQRDHQLGPLSQVSLTASGLARGKIAPAGLVGILPAGISALEKLTDLIFASSPNIERGTNYSSFQEELFSLILSTFLGRDASGIESTDLLDLRQKLNEWFLARAARRLVFVPCMISPWPSPSFHVGPVKFTFLEEFQRAQAASPQAEDFRDLHLNSLLEEMQREHSHWMAEVEIDGCDVNRATEIANLAVDLAITGLQLVAPYLTKGMARLFDRRGTGQIVTVHKSNERYSGGWSRVDPGTSIGPNYLAKIVYDARITIESVGTRVRSFATGNYSLPVIERAWCDAAYWLHQGIAEAIDSIAVTKLETAIEILLHAENSKGSERRMLLALDTFFALKPNDLVAPNSQTTAKEFAKGLVRDRSRILHGTWSTLNTRLAASRESLEHVAMVMIRSSAIELDLYLKSGSPNDDVEAFLSWVAARRGHA